MIRKGWCNNNAKTFSKRKYIMRKNKNNSDIAYQLNKCFKTFTMGVLT